MVEKVLDDIRENEASSRELLYDLARQGLEAMNKENLQDTYLANL